MKDGDDTDNQARLADVFRQSLVRQLRAHDRHGLADRHPDEKMLADYILMPEQRRELAIIGEPDQRVLWRIEQFYRAVGLATETVARVMPAVVLTINAEGFGQVVIIAGRLVLVHRGIRDAHRFGFASLDKLALAGGKLIAEALAALARFPDAARA